jgi:hypothetical protein
MEPYHQHVEYVEGCQGSCGINGQGGIPGCCGQEEQVRDSYRTIKSSCIDMNQSMIENLDNVLSYANITVAIVLLAHKS